MPLKRRARVAQHLVESLVAFPLLSRQPDALFHADPHAGHLLYNRHTSELVILDWALAERLSREQRRRLTLLFMAVALRNPMAASYEIEALSEEYPTAGPHIAATIREVTCRYIAALPMPKVPRAVDAMGLLEEVALAGVRFPSSLIMFSKVLFTLDGILDDIRGNGTTAEFTIARYLFKRWAREPFSFGLPLTVRDWLGVECSALLYAAKLGVRVEEALAARLFSKSSGVVCAAGSAA
jgi:predicted unusual protein kinase regulating ubiquinone biosynthesis (AarF/ABC1/UbiB family)